MKTLLLALLLSGANDPVTISCKLVGTRGCGEEGICIESARTSPTETEFDLKRGRFRSGDGSGQILSSELAPDGGHYLRLYAPPYLTGAITFSPDYRTARMITGPGSSADFTCRVTKRG